MVEKRGGVCVVWRFPRDVVIYVCVLVRGSHMWDPESDFEGEKLAQYQRLEGALGPQDRRRKGEDYAAIRGLSLSEKGCRELGVGSDMFPRWFEGVELPLTEVPPVVARQDYPSVLEDRQREAEELDRLADLGKIHWYEEGAHPPDLRVCPPHLIAEEEKNRMVHGWSRAQFPLNSLLVNPPAQIGAMDASLSTLPPGA